MHRFGSLNICVVVPALLMLLSGNAQARDLSPQEKSKIRDVVTEGFNDPDSARFRWLPLRSGAVAYCGMVNAKNRLGGYTGYSPFIVGLVTKGKVVSDVILMGVDADMAEGYYEVCAKNGQNPRLAR
jgi:hypothetical protein